VRPLTVRSEWQIQLERNILQTPVQLLRSGLVVLEFWSGNWILFDSEIVVHAGFLDMAGREVRVVVGLTVIVFGEWSN
jgi:hypothetical protein